MEKCSNEYLAVTNNRGLLYGDAVFETMKIVSGKILFFEDHYFRLMATMRIVRLEIPMEFTMEFLEAVILKSANLVESASVRCRMTVYRAAGGFYFPTTNDVGYFIESSPLNNTLYELENSRYSVELFKDFYIARHLLSTLKTNNRMINVTASIFAKENDFENCLLLNDLKNVVEAINGNIFMVFDGKVVTPPLSEGCLNGIMRKQVLRILSEYPELEVVERAISPFELQKATELFITNVISGIVPITDYRKKSYSKNTAEILVAELNRSLLEA